MAYINAWSMGTDVTFLRKLAASLAKNANDVQAESPATGEHQKRQLYAQKVAVDPYGAAQRMAQSVIQANAALKTAADTGGTAGPWTVVDTDLDNGVSSVWNTFAGVLT